MLNKEGEEKRGERLVEEEKRYGVQILEFDDYNEALVDETAS